MKFKNVKYGILLTKAQLDFLKDNHQGFHRPKAFDTFLSLAVIAPCHYEKKNFSTDLDIGQFAISKVELAELWGCDRKTAQKMIEHFNEVGILTSVANNRTTIHTIHCVAFWFVDGQEAPIKNPHYQRNPTISNSADQGKVSSETDNGISHSSPSSLISPVSVSSVAEADNDEREKNMQPPYGEDGQLPEVYYESLDEHYSYMEDKTNNADKECGGTKGDSSLPPQEASLSISMNEDSEQSVIAISPDMQTPSAEETSETITDSES